MTALAVGFAAVLALVANDALGILRPKSPYLRQAALTTFALLIVLAALLVVRVIQL
ncbi:MAG TPA: hypothetical protein VGN49_06570 [Micrococcaceae bacterium]|jgi:hypothetical protein|nr:hypothetical protein [Micrococcaceae bacterium]